MEEANDVFGEEFLLWVCLLRQSPRRPPADHVHRQANFLLEEARTSPAAQGLPVVSVDDGLFGAAALLDEAAMALPDLRVLWSSAPLQATRWTTNNAGVEFYERLERVRQGPKSVLATYLVVLGAGFLGRYGYPGADRYAINQLRRQLQIDLGADPDRDRQGGVLCLRRGDVGPAARFDSLPFYRTLLFGRLLGAALTLVGVLVLVLALI